MNDKISLKNITMRYPGGVVANRNISIDVKPGEIHALAGENGAGKSTLMNILFGLLRPTEGQIYIDGNPVNFSSPRDSIAHKIGMVHQHFMLVPKLTVAENIIIGQEIGPSLKIDRKAAEAKVNELSERYGLEVNASSLVKDLSVNMQQRVEILKVLYREADILIFDEPTAVLAPKEIDEFCEILLNLKKSGKTILFISHKLDEIMNISDSVTVIRLGQVVGTVSTSQTNPGELTRMMVGRSVKLTGHERVDFPEGEVALLLDKVDYTLHNKVKKLNNVTLELRRGEILGICGVDGNGQSELVSVMTGQIKPNSGSVYIDGQDVTNDNIREHRANGMSLIPEDRHKQGLVLQFSVEDNLILGRHKSPQFSQNGRWLKAKDINKYGNEMRDQYDIRSASAKVNASTLSGGNQQKIIIARELDCNPNIIIAVQPTRGLDIGAIEFVQNSLIDERNKGKAVMLVSLELDEILALSDRIAVIHRGAIVGELDAKNVSREELGILMLGAVPGHEDGGQKDE